MTGDARARNLRSLEAIFDSLRVGDWETVLTYWDADGVMEIPYAPGGTPGRYQGIEAISANQRTSRAMFSAWETREVDVHPTTDPDIFFAEYASRATVAATGREYANHYVGYFRFHDGRLVHWKEYFDPGAIRAAFR